MQVRNVLAGVAVSDLPTSRDWYNKLLVRGPDQEPMKTLAEYAFPGGGWLQIFEDTERAGQSSVTLAVDDLDVWVVHAGSHAMEATKIQTSDLVRTTTLTDPDGNRIVLAEARTPDNKSVA